MTAAADRLPRLLALVPYLRTHQGAELADLATVFGVQVRQLRDDLNLLWVCGLPGRGPGDLIDFAFEGDTVRVVQPQTLDRPLKLTADEALALRVAARALADVPGLAEREALESAQAKLAFASSAVPELAGPSAAAPLQVALEPETEVLAIVRRAQREGRQLHLRYLVPSRDEVTERTVTPMRLVSVDGRWYLEGWCQLAEGVRLLRLDRMVEAVPGGVAEPLPSEAVPRDLAEGLFRPRADDLTVVLELEPAARWVADYYAVETATEVTDRTGPPGTVGRLRVELRTPNPAWVVRLALRLGGQGRVIGPPEVVAAVRERATAGLAALAALESAAP